MIKHSIEINRPAEEVFAYLDQVDRHNEWQGQLVSTTVETDGPVRVGTRVVERLNVELRRPACFGVLGVCVGSGQGVVSLCSRAAN